LGTNSNKILEHQSLAPEEVYPEELRGNMLIENELIGKQSLQRSEIAI
jgi:hypothetical protein